MAVIDFTESRAAELGYASWHRTADGSLKRGELSTLICRCPVSFVIYEPLDLRRCPQILIVCRNQHSHPPPPAVRTPPIVKAYFIQLLVDMGWKLADATPRRIMLDSGLIGGLRRYLQWPSSITRDPMLQDLHPSLGNLDHTTRLILELRSQHFPAGTGFEGAQLMARQHETLPTEECYIRFADECTEGNEKFRIVICMSPQMSRHLLSAKRLSIDTSFKRLHGWQEFEMESWDNENMKSVVGDRAFTSSQTAIAHFVLFRLIFEIAELDTGVPVAFRHIHGYGFESVIADGHKGQGLGLGKFCMHLCRGMEVYCSSEPHRRLCDLGPYDHLRRFYRPCVVHYKRNILAIRSHITSEVQADMFSLSSCEPHPDFEGTLKLIANGGKKAKAWLNDKVTGTKFALTAIYWPRSLIPLHIWKASPSTTNGNEQAHRSINRDGVNLTLLGGIMRGFQYDERAMRSIAYQQDTGVLNRDYMATHVYRATRSISRRVAVANGQYSQYEGAAGDAYDHATTTVDQHYGAESQLQLPDNAVTYQYPNNVSIHPDTSDIPSSSFSTLAWALTPGAHVSDPVVTEYRTGHIRTMEPVYISTYSALAGALGANGNEPTSKLHLEAQFLKFGPCYDIWAYGFERFNGLISHFNHSQNEGGELEATLMRRWWSITFNYELIMQLEALPDKTKEDQECIELLKDKLCAAKLIGTNAMKSHLPSRLLRTVGVSTQLTQKNQLSVKWSYSISGVTGKIVAVWCSLRIPTSGPIFQVCVLCYRQSAETQYPLHVEEKYKEDQKLKTDISLTRRFHAGPDIFDFPWTIRASDLGVASWDAETYEELEVIPMTSLSGHFVLAPASVKERDRLTLGYNCL
ncbi:hypothetical protein CONPUDRAFT_147995 [Coniophora puteana RWD-64-598 SS2]|uniref:Uncharacterized protein n=1 Tax=Coniophora puteana (strain RWD-64-598) TaxID=741705 RepID=R7SCH4_CONPW|nr:uncharacterized protein CONPUDRAFT_147995 [Coniophora puteana RWD-64-598 SS2]EIW73871.1 hypothetical protein CONPUDRAFT_147995 [Coniophora puteana RWD-64-598 SS2]